VPHSWKIESLELNGNNNKILYFTKKAISYWKTSMRLYTERKVTETEDLEITRGIHQGDSSPLLLCISLIPFTEQLNKLNTGYEEQTTKQQDHNYFTWMIGKTEDELKKKCK
jgi:hypothetical protein